MEGASLARSWDEAAAGYDEFWVPRFAPWVEAAVEQLAGEDIPPGPILVPCCGTFPELGPVARRLPGREVVGLDLSPEMVRRAAVAARSVPGARAVLADAAALGSQWVSQCAAVVSVFGLQQLPDPPQAVVGWLKALRPGGCLSVLFWPSVTEADGPFATMSSALRRQGARNGGAKVPAEDDRVGAALVAAGGEIVRDDYVSFPIEYPSAAAFFDAYVHSGPMRAFAANRGQAVIDRMRAEFFAEAPDGPWTHEPRARLICARRGAHTAA